MLQNELHQTVKPDENLCQQILNMGFDIELIRQVLKNNTNDMQKAIDSLLKMQSDGTYGNVLEEVLKSLPTDPNAPSTSSMPSTSAAIQDMADEMQVRLLRNYEKLFQPNSILFNQHNSPINSACRRMTDFQKILNLKIMHTWTYH